MPYLLNNTKVCIIICTLTSAEKSSRTTDMRRTRHASGEALHARKRHYCQCATYHSTCGQAVCNCCSILKHKSVAKHVLPYAVQAHRGPEGRIDIAISKPFKQYEHKLINLATHQLNDGRREYTTIKKMRTPPFIMIYSDTHCSQASATERFHQVNPLTGAHV